MKKRGKKGNGKHFLKSEEKIDRKKVLKKVEKKVKKKN